MCCRCFCVAVGVDIVVAVVVLVVVVAVIAAVTGDGSRRSDDSVGEGAVRSNLSCYQLHLTPLRLL